MAFSKNHFNGEYPLKTSYDKENFATQFAERYLKVKNEIFFSNKNILKIFNYVCPSSA